MAKRQTSVRKREREMAKRQRALAKSRKAAEKRDRRHNKAGQAAPPLSPQPGELDSGASTQVNVT